MISKRVPMNSAKKSSFTGLVNYISDTQGINERVGAVTITNCLNSDLEWALKEVRETQRLNTTAEGDKTYHLLISFAPGEKPSAEVMKDIEERLCAAMGYAEHQRISAVHNDTDAVHIHVAINKIHPTRHTMLEPYRDFKIRSDMCAKLEVEHGLQRVDHSGGKHLSENKAIDMERHAGIESLVSWVRRECLDQLQSASSWQGLHQKLSENGLSIQERGTGFVLVSSDGTMVKASTVARDLSRKQLEQRLGSYQAHAGNPKKRTNPPGEYLKRPGIGRVGRRPPSKQKGRPVRPLSALKHFKIGSGKRYEKRPVKHRTDTTELYARFRDEQSAVRHERAKQIQYLRTSRIKAVEDAKRSAALKRSAIKLMGGAPLTKRLLYARVHKVLQDEITKIRADHSRATAQINSSFKARQWADWLQSKAKQGDESALKALRARAGASGLKGNALTPVEPLDHKVTPVAAQAPKVEQDHITKEGTIIYRAGASAIRDDGSRLQLSRGATNDGVETALRMAVARYGQTISVTGSAGFKELVAQTAVSRNLNIQFADPALEQRRLFLQQSKQENKHVRHDRGPVNGIDRGRVDRGRNGQDAAGTPRAASGGRGRFNGDTSGTPAGGSGVSTRAELPGRVSGTGNGGLRSGSVALRPEAGAGKPGIGRVGRKPPTFAKNRLRALSELGVVQLTRRSEVLLPRHVHDNVEHKGTQPDNRLRRDVSDGRLIPSVGDAASRYIAEREAKRQKGFDIPKHRLYNSADEGAASFAGVRTINQQHVVLLKREEEVLVMPVDEATARRAKRMKLGEAVTATAKGGIKRKGRSR